MAKTSLADYVAAMQSGQAAALVTLIGLLIDKGIITPEEILERLRHTSEQLSASDAGDAAATPVEAVIALLERSILRRSSESSQKPN